MLCQLSYSHHAWSNYNNHYDFALVKVTIFGRRQAELAKLEAASRTLQGLNGRGAASPTG